MAPETELIPFFAGCPQLLGPYRAMEAKILAEFPWAVIEVKKTQISFKSHAMFACFSVPRRKSDRESGALLLSVGLMRPLSSSRVLMSAETGSGRFTHHILLHENEFDEEILSWLREAQAVADRPSGKRK